MGHFHSNPTLSLLVHYEDWLQTHLTLLLVTLKLTTFLYLGEPNLELTHLPEKGEIQSHSSS